MIRLHPLLFILTAPYHLALLWLRGKDGPCKFTGTAKSAASSGRIAEAGRV